MSAADAPTAGAPSGITRRGSTAADSPSGHVRVIGADETVVRVNGEKTVVGVVTDAATGEVLGMEALAERGSDGFMEWLGDFARVISWARR